MTNDQGEGSARPFGGDDVRHLCGDIADWKVSTILAVGASVEAVSDVLVADEEFGDEDRGS